ncbi:hypothetical protein ACQ7B2_06500, partial [Escherichia coli]
LELPYVRRRAVLAELGLDDAVTKTPPYRADHADADLLHSAAEREGVVAKRLDSPYQPGNRSRHWIKI